MFCWHKYTKWETEGKRDIYGKHNLSLPIRVVLVQYKTCTKCGKIKYRNEEM